MVPMVWSEEFKSFHIPCENISFHCNTNIVIKNQRNRFIAHAMLTITVKHVLGSILHYGFISINIGKVGKMTKSVFLQSSRSSAYIGTPEALARSSCKLTINNSFQNNLWVIVSRSSIFKCVIVIFVLHSARDYSFVISYFNPSLLYSQNTA